MARRLDAGIAALKAEGIEAAGFVADAGNPVAITSAIESARRTLGPIAVLQWTAYGMGGGDLTTASPDEVRAIIDIPLVGLTAALQASLPERGVHVGEVVIAGLVKGTAFDQGNATIEPSAVADAFWKLHSARSEVSVTVG